TVDNLLTGRRSNIAHLANDSRFEFVEKDICQPFDVGRVDYVFHFASPASPVDYHVHGIATLQVGSLGTFHALDVARKYAAKYLVSSTSECYGDPLEHPQKETYWGNVNSIGPRSVYDEAKRFTEAATMAYYRYHKVDTRIARIFNTYGPRMQLNDGRVVPNFMKQALRGEDLTVYGDGSQTRSFCYVSDEVDGFIRLSKSSEHLPVNIGNPNEFTILECAQQVLKVTRSKSKIAYEPLPQDDPKQRRPDIAKARQLLGWEPRIDLQSGLRMSLDYFRNAVSEEADASR
ncbi:MAG TPA: GDP-mannose 4,6-dehydratase, partial [Candidatus Polarisedimenticolia bacterium]|nr:GDP-mannose 4,6-dehydratase [Candidatus Polarisedimenticolia bacterium]